MATITFPVDFITYDNVTFGTYTDVQREQLLILGTTPGADDLGRVRIHAKFIAGNAWIDSTTVQIGRASQGTRDGELALVDNAFISVLDLRMIMAAPPRIDTSDPDEPFTYKDGRIIFIAGDEFRPIVNIGGDRLKKAASSGGSASFDFDASGSIVTNPSAGATKTYLWNVGDGTITSGSTTTAAITASFPVGARYIECTVTDDQGIDETSWRLVAVTYDGDPNLISQATLKRRQPADGQEVSLQVDSALPYSTYPDGTEVLIRQRERYGATYTGSLAGQPDAEDMIFAGWIQSEPNTSGEMKKTGYRTSTTLQLVDAAGRLKTLPGFPLVVERRNTVGTTTVWEHMRSATMDRYAYHLAKWHSTVPYRADFYWSGTGDTYPMPTLGSDGQSLWDQFKFVANAIACLLTCDKNGRIWMVGDPNIQPSASQVSAISLPVQRTTTVIVALGTGDWKNWKFDYTRPPRVHWNWGSAIIGSTDVPSDDVQIGTVFCVAPGAAPSQGVDEQTSGQQLVNPDSPQSELNAREYNRYQARMNARFGNPQFEIRPGDIGIDPALGQWVTLTIDAATAAQRGRTLSGNCLPTEVQYEYDGRKGTCKTTLTVEPEVNSAFFAEVDLSKVTTPITPQPPTPPIMPPTTPPSGGASGLSANVATLYVVDKTNKAIWKWTRGTGLWTLAYDLTTSIGGVTLSGTIVSAVWRVGGNVMRIITSTKIYRLNNYSSGTPALVLDYSFPETVTDRVCNFERSEKDWGIVASYSPSVGVLIDYTTDGHTWTRATGVPAAFAHVDSNPSNGPYAGLWIDPHRTGHALVSAFSTGGFIGGALAGAVYETTDHGANWHLYAGSSQPLNQWLANMLVVAFGDPAANNIYHGYTTVVGGDVAFDLYRNATKISPVVSGTEYGYIQGYRCCSVCDSDPNSILIIASALSNQAAVGQWLSRNQGASWIVQFAPSSSFNGRQSYFVDINAAFDIGAGGLVLVFNGTRWIDISVPAGGENIALMGP